MTTKLRLLGLLLLIAACTPAYAQLCDCVSTGNCPVPVTDNGTFQGTLDVTVNGPNDLAVNPLTEVCFTITHTWIGDLSVSLTSPSGLTYILMADENNNYGGCGMQEDNIDVCIVLGDNNPIGNGSSNYVCNAGPCPAGVCCLTGDYTVACGGVEDPITNAIEAPNCNLNDFNVPGDPANGTWTLTVNDVCNMDTGTLDNFSLVFGNGIESCIVCSAEGGTLDSMDVISCYGNPNLLLDLPPNYPGMPPDSSAYEYIYIISQNGIILEVDSLADLTSQPAGTYQVHGLSHYIEDTMDLNAIIGLDTSLIISQLASTTAPFCGDFSSNWINVTIVPEVPVTHIDTTVCEGDCITVGSQTVCTSEIVTLSSWLGCDSVVDVTLTPILPDTVNQTVTTCEGACVDIGGNSYCAPGPHYITLPTWQGCDSVIVLDFDEITVNAVVDPATPPAITCTNGSVTLDGSGSSANTYEWSGPNGFSSTQSSVMATEPGDYTLTVFDNTLSPPCSASTTVTIDDGVLPPDLTVTGAAPQICTGESFDLSTLTIQDQNNTNPSISFHNGTPATQANELSSTLVSPSAATTYYILGTNGSCADETSVTITVNTIPTADFSASSSICVSDQATVTYTGSALTSATFDWDFDGGIAIGSGAGPYQVSWSGAGTYTISLNVEENGCTSASFTQDVTVDEPLEAPVISCNATTSSVEFTWPDVSGATSYNVTVISGSSGSDNGPNTYLVTGLSPGDAVTIEVEAIGNNACGNSTSQQTCVAQDCPSATIDIDPVADICLDAATSPFDLNATVTGGNGAGTLSWSGNGITDPDAGTFDPAQANIGANTITATYQEDNCTYTQTITVNVFERPEASLIANSPLCTDELTMIVFNGTADAGSIYTWNFDGGNTTNTGAGPYTVSWATPGTKTITLTVESPDGCVSETTTETVDIISPLDTPVVSCSVTTSSILFSWNDVGADDYIVTVLSSHSGNAPSATSYEVTGLSPGEQVDIEIEAVGTGPCDNTVVLQSCQTTDCPPVVLSIDPVADVCTNSTTIPIQLTAGISGTTPIGTLTWSGNGITDPVAGTFDPLLANPGANEVVLTYEESTCFYADTLQINVYQTPDASFSTDPLICEGDLSQVVYTGSGEPGLSFDWDFGGGSQVSGGGAGPYEISWPAPGTYTITFSVQSPEGCVSETATATVEVDEPLQTPVITCSATTTTVEFSWNDVPGASDYLGNVPTGQTGTLNGNTYLFTDQEPDTQIDFELTVSGTGACPDVTTTISCATEPCPDIAVDVIEIPDFCLGTAAPVQLSVAITGSDGSGSGSWSGSGIVDAAAGTFDPAVAGFGAHMVKYSFEEKECVFQDSMIIGVYQQPTSDFTAADAICIEDQATVSFNGTAGPTAVFSWNFDGGTAFPGTGAGPHQVSWNTPGDKTVTLTVAQSGCTSTLFTQQVQVDDTLEGPSVVCHATTASVEFDWNDVPGATGYDITVLNGPSGTQNTATSYLIPGLDPGQEVAIQITPVSNTICEPETTVATCNASECNDYEVVITPVDPVCLNDDMMLIDLIVALGGAPASGTGVWSGPGVIDSLQGVFDPVVAGEGTHTIRFDYQLINCLYSDEIEIKVAPPPVADAGEDGILSCWESEQVVRLGGDGTSSGLSITYLWTADFGDFPENESIPNPQVSQPGVFTLVVTNEELGCSTSDEVSVTSISETPVPSVSIHRGGCEAGQSALVSIDGISGGMEPYFFSLNGDPFVETDTFPFLSAGDYELMVIDGAGCENSVFFTIEPFSTDPPGVELTANIVGVNLVKEGESVQLIALTNLVEGDIDSIVWSHPDLLNCTQCLDPVATPLETTTFYVTIYANGCEVTDELKIIVEYESSVYVPNAFSPNADGTNDIFRLYPGPQVTRIHSFLVFDRWGNMVFQQQDYDPADHTVGWDGRFEGKLMNAATFIWMAEVEFADGSVRIFEGDVSLIR